MPLWLVNSALSCYRCPEPRATIDVVTTHKNQTYLKIVWNRTAAKAQNTNKIILHARKNQHVSRNAVIFMGTQSTYMTVNQNLLLTFARFPMQIITVYKLIRFLQDAQIEKGIAYENKRFFYIKAHIQIEQDAARAPVCERTPVET